MAETATSTKKVADQILADLQQSPQAKKKTATTPTAATPQSQTDNKFADIETNTFYKLIFKSQLDPEQKKEEVAKALTFDPDAKEDCQKRLKEWTEFKEFLQNERKNVAQEIIKMTDTEAFSELQAVIDQLNTGVLDFDKRMTPLTDIIDAVYKLRQQGGETVLGVFKEIRDDQAAEEQRKKDVEQKQQDLQGIKSKMNGIDGDLAVLQNTKSGKYRKWFGYGGLKEDTIREIAEKQNDKSGLSSQASQTADELTKLQDPNTARDTQYAQFAQEKAKLRELLDLTSEQHKQRQKELVQTATDFVNNCDARVGSVLGHLDGMSGQIEGLGTVNNGMQNIYAIASEASKLASDNNQKVRDVYKPPEGKEESPIEQMQRESKKQAAEEFITAMDASTVDTMKTYSDLSSQAIRIKQMKDANREQVAKTRELHSSGIAGVADRLSTVLQAVSAAALNESSEAAKQSVATMNDKTNAVAMKESIRTAIGMKDAAMGLNKAIDDLAAYSQVQQEATRIAREGIQAVNDAKGKLEQSIKDVREKTKEAYAVNADVKDGAQPAASNDDQAPRPAAPASSSGPAPSSNDLFKKLAQ